MKKNILRIGIAAIVLLATLTTAAWQTNSGPFRVNGANFATVGNTLILEATVGGGGNVGLLGSGANTVKLTQNDGATLLGSVAATQACGTATACSLTQPSALKVVYGSCTAVGATTCTITALPFSATGSYFCNATDTTTAANNALKIANASATSTVITTASSSDTFNYMCMGT